MHLNLGIVKEHPYAVGGAVLVGGFILVMLLSSSGGSSASTAATSSSANMGQLLSADLQLQSLQSSAAVSAQQSQVALTTAQLQADTQNKQTAAALEAQKSSDLTGLAGTIYGDQSQVQIAGIQAASDTAQQANQLQYAQNMQQMQDDVLTANIQAATQQNADNDSAMIAGQQITANYQIGVAQLQHDSNTVNDLTALAANGQNNAATIAQTQIAAGVVNNATNDAYAIQQSKQDAINSQLSYITAHAGDKKNSALDAVDQTSVFNTILSGFNPGVASTGTVASTSAANSGNAATASIISSVGSTVASLGKSVSSGLFG